MRKIIAPMVAIFVGALLLTGCTATGDIEGTVVKPGNDSAQLAPTNQIVDVQITTPPEFELTNPDEDEWVLSTEQADEGFVALRNKNTGCVFAAEIIFTPNTVTKGWGDGFLTQYVAYNRTPNMKDQKVITVKASGVTDTLTLYTGKIKSTISTGNSETTDSYGWVGYHTFDGKKYENWNAPGFPVTQIEYLCPSKKDSTLKDYNKALDSLTVILK